MDQVGWAAQAVLTTAQMAAADQAAVRDGVAGIALMEAAGAQIVAAIEARFEAQPVAVLCGPGNNGGDGFIAARLLRERGWSVRVALLGDREALAGDAKLAAQRWEGDGEGDVAPLSPDILTGTTLVIDALFGAGLNRAPDGAAAQTLQAICDRAMVAVDIPSGISGDSGADLAALADPDRPTPTADLTVSFFRAKPGHYLLPGRARCGALALGDIGITDDVLDAIAPAIARNDPALWRPTFPIPEPHQHKYSRGHLLVAGGAEMLGAGRLATRAAQRAGAGMVTLASPHSAAPLYRVSLDSAVVRAFRDTKTFVDMVEEERVSACLIGPGLGEGTVAAREKVLAALRTGKPVVLDADALSLFEGGAQLLFDSVRGPVILTPHEGEFRRLFPDLADLSAGSKVDRVRAAAKRAGAVVLLKGYDSVIAAPDGRVVINTNAPAWLASAGSGDVLAGFAGGLMAQFMPPFEAACAAAWLQGAAGAAVGPGLVADDLPERLPAVLSEMLGVT
jgi:NAD(P)H-hydrate epimerase